jgi:hypothetical protein
MFEYIRNQCLASPEGAGDEWERSVQDVSNVLQNEVIIREDLKWNIIALDHS